MRDPLAARIEISRAALLHNVRSLRARLGPDRMIAAVLKGNAYGHGRDLVGGIVAEHVDLLAAADPVDAVALARLAPGKALSLGPAHGAILAECIARGVRVAVSDQRQLDGLDQRTRVHLLVDTGVHRLGVAPQRAEGFAHAIRASGAQIESAFCMVARADYGDWDAVAEEVRLLRELPLGVACFHTGGSSVVLERPDLAGQIGRPGLALLGYHPRRHQRDLVDLQPSLRLIAPILELRIVPAGDSVGYQARRLERETVVATLPIGVAHGLHPCTDSRAVAEVDGMFCPIMHEPSLDYCLLDVTDAPNAQVGDEAVLLGGRPGSPTSVIDVANRLGVLVDHVLAPLSASLRRVAVV